MITIRSKKIVLSLLGFISLLYISYVIYNSIHSINNITTYISLKNITIALIPCLFMLLFQSLLHVLIIEDIEGKRITSKIKLMASYSTSQIIRYLPGKVLGIIYQSEKLEKIVPKKTIWIANIHQTVINLGNSVIVLITVYIMLSLGMYLAITFAFISLLFLFFFIKQNFTYKLFNKFTSKNLKKLSLPSIKNNKVITEIIFLELEWLFYLLTWYLLSPNDIYGNGFILIGVAYAAASFIGMLAFIIPSGWLVREASFIWIGGVVGLSQNLLLVYSVIARVLFIVGDLLWALITATLYKIKKSGEKSESTTILG